MDNGQNNLPQSSVAACDLGEEAAGCPVKERCWEQREALPGEPRCVICGRYGEYICDETDDDICSTECKKALLGRIAKSQKPPSNLSHSVKLLATDECFYVRANDRSVAADQNVEFMRKKIDVSVKGESVPAPVMSFSNCNFPQRLEQNLETAGYEIPTPVQMQAIPAALAKRNLLVSADTGSAPTRELCVQVEEQAKVLGKGLPFKTALVVGGDALAGQVYRIQKGVELIVGTPGRLIDLLTKNDVELDEVSVLVLDEVDCMLQRGFRDQVMQIFLALSHPQILMFSATISQDVEKMASSLAKNLIRVSSGKSSKPTESVKQIVIWVESKKKKQKLFEILKSKQHFRPPVVVFVSSRVGADLLSEAITAATGLNAASIHGEKEMAVRRESLRLFLTGEISVIVSTGILGRGVDLLKVRQVVIFDMPNTMEEYVHQVGRASRMGEAGTALAFVNEDDKKLFRVLVENLRSAGAAIPRELANSHYSVGTYPVGGREKRRKYVHAT